MECLLIVKHSFRFVTKNSQISKHFWLTFFNLIICLSSKSLSSTIFIARKELLYTLSFSPSPSLPPPPPQQKKAHSDAFTVHTQHDFQGRKNTNNPFYEPKINLVLDNSPNSKKLLIVASNHLAEWLLLF